MASKNDHIARLKQVPMFAALNTKDLSSIAHHTDEATLPAGHKLIVEGKQGHEAYVIVAGTVTVSRGGRKIANLGPGDVVGELSLLESSLRAASVTCDTECTVLVLDQRNFRTLLQNTPALGIKFLEELAGRLRALDRTAFG